MSETTGLFGLILLGLTWFALRDMSTRKSHRRPRR